MMIKLTPLGKRLVFPDGHVEEGFAVEFESEMDEIAALKAERDRLRASLEEILLLSINVFNDPRKDIERIARRELEKK